MPAAAFAMRFKQTLRLEHRRALFVKSRQSIRDEPLYRVLQGDYILHNAARFETEGGQV
ncbi:hypothetical protein [Candidatus Burkholderia verschuerenii]|uniref:hypothetical protein n=1 Tax=Candidatus Burkholderia verschuerenii TaxID=242163 RepID=UPI000A7470D0|nr:hypothetical protein [Candidatus Burkholderia verschuerenii]